MKIYKIPFFLLVLSCFIIFIYACNNDDDVQADNTIKQRSEIINTYRDALGENVDSIQEITLKHTLVQNISDKITFDYKDNTEAAIYYYSNNYEALIIEDVKNTTANEAGVYAYLFKSDTKQLIDILYTQYTIVNATRSTNKRISAKMTSLITNSLITQYDSFNRVSWGECMSDGMDLLYNDWSKDPGGTLSCWLTGYLCVVGGAIGCTIQSW